ncbi:MAG: GatB/YqeY domain-containing protein [Candidatus Uhrbacteria bacterium]
MTLIDQLNANLIAAMKEKDAARMSALRMLKATLANAEIANRGSEKRFDDVAALAVVKMHAKQLRDAMVEYERGGRPDLADAACVELAIVELYLPAALSEDEIKKIVAAVRERTGLAQVGQLMGAVMKELAGKADGTTVRKIVEEMLRA